MNRFLYFVPGLSGAPTPADVLAAAPELSHAFAPGDEFTPVECHGGPGGRSGILCAYGDGLGLAYKPDEQLWFPLLGARAACPHCGMSKDPAKQPGPLNLARKGIVVDGHDVKLGDGKHWRVPIIRFVNGDTRLPRVLRIGADGRGEYVLREAFAPLFAMAQHILNECLQGQGASLSADALLDFASGALSVNYRVSKHEVAALGLLDTQNIQQICDAAVDGPTLCKLLDEFKKKLAARATPGSASATGARESPATVQVGPR